MVLIGIEPVDGRDRVERFRSAKLAEQRWIELMNNPPCTARITWHDTTGRIVFPSEMILVSTR